MGSTSGRTDGKGDGEACAIGAASFTGSLTIGATAPVSWTDVTAAARLDAAQDRVRLTVVVNRIPQAKVARQRPMSGPFETMNAERAAGNIDAASKMRTRSAPKIRSVVTSEALRGIASSFAL
jgi:hypothetical protein